MDIERASSPQTIIQNGITVTCSDGKQIFGDLMIPSEAKGIVLFAHGSGSSRYSTRNRRVAAHLVESGFGTFLFDLMTEGEDREDQHGGHNRFDIPLITSRLVDATKWLQAKKEFSEDAQGNPRKLAYFGASTGAAAALSAASELPRGTISAIVSRGGRPDMGINLEGVNSPTLLLVGSNDPQVIVLNRQAKKKLVNCETEMTIIPGATHLFEEHGCLEQVEQHATTFLAQHLK